MLAYACVCVHGQEAVIRWAVPHTPFPGLPSIRSLFQAPQEGPAGSGLPPPVSALCIWLRRRQCHCLPRDGVQVSADDCLPRELPPRDCPCLNPPLSHSDLLQNPLLVPVKVLRGHTLTRDLGVLDVAFHPTQPWVFSSGADGTVRLFS